MVIRSSLLVLLGLAVMAAGKLQIPKIQRLKHQAEVLSAASPNNGAYCFPIYTPKLDATTQRYEREYNLCNTVYSADTADEDSKWQGPRHELEERGQYACDLMTDCSTVVGVVEAFECYAQVGSDQSKTMYTISANALQTSVVMEESYQKLTAERNICINNAERTYVEDTAATYEALNDCLKNPHRTEPTPTTRSTTTTHRPPTVPTITTDDPWWATSD